jgi:hypothetical protein
MGRPHKPGYRQGRVHHLVPARQQVIPADSATWEAEAVHHVHGVTRRHGAGLCRGEKHLVIGLKK